VSKLWAAGGREEAGVDNQKQEPHTKLWGTTNKAFFLVLILDHLKVSTISIPFNSKIPIPQEMKENV
jgi:hypothetical protein